MIRNQIVLEVYLSYNKLLLPQLLLFKRHLAGWYVYLAVVRNKKAPFQKKKIPSKKKKKKTKILFILILDNYQFNSLKKKIGLRPSKFTSLEIGNNHNHNHNVCNLHI